MTKFIPVLENTFYQWYDWLINHISESMKKSGNYTKLKVILFELKIDNDTTTDSKKKKWPMPLNIGMLNTRVAMIKDHQWKDTLKKLDCSCVIW